MKPRVLVVFPTGNGRTGLWFEGHVRQLEPGHADFTRRPTGSVRPDVIR